MKASRAAITRNTGFCPGVILLTWLLSLATADLRAQLVSSGYSVSNPDWEILVTHYGYADLALDRREGFKGREYLSGEWAGALVYQGGKNPAGPVWLQPQWLYPDWLSNSDFQVVTEFGVATPQNPANEDGFTVYRSVISNGDVEITIFYEMRDTETGIEQGGTPAGEGGTGNSLTSNRYVFHQTHVIRNISGGSLTGVRFFQLLHGLEMTHSLFDNRDYGGPYGEYRFDITQRGESYSFNSNTREVVLHDDVIAFHARHQPTRWENGYYGIEGTDSHVAGKPGTGVHLSVEADNLNNLDLFSPPEERWVSGAQRFELMDMAPAEIVEIDFLVSLQTVSETRFAQVVIETRKVELKDGKFRIEFRETSGAPVGFILHRAASLAPFPSDAWEPLLIPYSIDGQTGVISFEAEIGSGDPMGFFALQPVL